MKSLNRSAFRFPTPAVPLRYDGERYVSGLVGDIQNEHYHRYLLALAFCDDKDVLDVASGEGYGSACLGQVARSVIGVDTNAEAVDFANANYMNDRVSFRQGQAQDLPIESESIDVVVSFETLEHLVEHELFAREIRRVLRPEGLLVMSSPNRTVYTEEANYHNEFHLRELDRDEFVAFLHGNFSNVKLLSQRTLIGSVIGNEQDEPVGKPEGFLWRGNGVFERTNGTPHPPFFVALASDATLPEVRSSMLHNPAPLYHVEEMRQRAVKALEERTAQFEECQRSLTAQASELSNVLEQRSEHVRELENALAERSAKAGQLESILAERSAQAGQLESALAQSKQQVTALVAEQQHNRENQSLRSNTEKRIAALRNELEGARRRSEELISRLNTELRSEQALTAELRKEKERLSGVLDGVLTSASWKVTAPLRTAVAHLPSAGRRQYRRLLKPLFRGQTSPEQELEAEPEPLPIALAPTTATTVAPPTQTAAVATEKPAPPSEVFRSAKPDWVQPQSRPEFIHLRTREPQARIAVVMHLYYTDLWQEMSQALLNIVEPFDLFVTLVSGAEGDVAPKIRAAFPQAVIVTVDNHGRDILPFLEFVRCGVLFKYELLCKLHSKRTPWREGGNEWRQHLIGGVLGSRETVGRILGSFDSDPDLGLVVADHQLFNGRDYWASNEARLLELFPTIGLKANSFEKSFAGGSIFWIRPFLLRTIDALGLGFDDFDPEPIGSDGTTAHAVERLISLVCQDAGMRIEETRNVVVAPGVSAGDQRRVQLIANYLPQFHPIPENDVWWGPGFTEWTNVTGARPLFLGHRQPRLPADLGFYDLRLPAVRQAQADLARQYGVTGFSYYYYWFNGRRLLNLPLDEVLASGRPDFPFMICWANEPWTRNWEGLAKEVLLPQDYEPGWEQSFAADIAPLLRDPRYIRLNGRPVVAIYRVMHIPDPATAMFRLRASLAEEGMPQVHLIGGWLQLGADPSLPARPEEVNLDAYFEFPPHGIPVQKMGVEPAQRIPGFAAHLYDYSATVDATIDYYAGLTNGHRYRGVMAGWDNTPRRGVHANAFHGATPTNFRRWLRAAIEHARAEAKGTETAVFINAWNEWAEGTYLEPDRDFGHGWLEAVASAANGSVTSLSATEAQVLVSRGAAT